MSCLIRVFLFYVTYRYFQLLRDSLLESKIIGLRENNDIGVTKRLLAQPSYSINVCSMTRPFSNNIYLPQRVEEVRGTPMGSSLAKRLTPQPRRELKEFPGNSTVIRTSNKSTQRVHFNDRPHPNYMAISRSLQR